MSPFWKAFKNSRFTVTQKEKLRLLVLANVKFSSTKFKSNLTEVGKTAFKNLKSNENIINTKADEEGGIVIRDKNHIENVNKLLIDGPYITLSRNPFLQELEKIKSAIKSFFLLLNPTKSQFFSQLCYILCFA